jgi:hypothetical protein
VPSLEAAVILKAYAWNDRPGTDKDAIDISNLLHVHDQHGGDALGGWALNAPVLTGTRLDASRRLHTLADRADAGRYKSAPIDTRDLVILIREHVTRTD